MKIIILCPWVPLQYSKYHVHYLTRVDMTKKLFRSKNDQKAYTHKPVAPCVGKSALKNCNIVNRIHLQGGNHLIFTKRSVT